ncbi:MAG: hypothetical protein ACI94Y_002729 [Maribacter sp.]|jgi:hypothetical protein
MQSKIFFLFSCSMLFFNCNNKISEINKNDIDKIEYEFTDSSVPPRYHRSYIITVTPNQVHVTVNSYGTELANETYPIEKTVFEQLVKNVSMLDAADKKITRGATGTSGNSINLLIGSEVIYDLYWDSLMKRKISEETKKYVEMIKATVPNLSELTGRSLPSVDDGE